MHKFEGKAVVDLKNEGIAVVRQILAIKGCSPEQIAAVKGRKATNMLLVKILEGN